MGFGANGECEEPMQSRINNCRGSKCSGIDTIGLLQSVDLVVDMVQNGAPGISVPDYVDTNMADKVVRIIQSYVGVVNKMVWRKG